MSSDAHMSEAAAHASSFASPGFGVHRSVGRPPALSQPPGSADQSPHVPSARGFSQWVNNSGFAPVSEPNGLPGIGAYSMSIPMRRAESGSLASIAGRERELGRYIKEEEEQMSRDVPSQFIPRPQSNRALATRGNETFARRPFESWPNAGEQIIRSCTCLGALDPLRCTRHNVLFYFGVLTTQHHLRPQFNFIRDDASGRWGVKLTLYGQTLLKPNLYGSKSSVKVEVCREALGYLKQDYAQWTVPDEPSEFLTAPEWNWVELLEGNSELVHLAIPVANIS